MASSNLAAASRSLSDLYGRHRQSLPAYQWENEEGRWHELLVSALTAGAGLDPEVTRRALGVLDDLNILSVEVLRKTNSEGRKFVATVIHQCGATPKAAEAATKVMCILAERVHEQWNGHVHRLLRMFAGPMTREAVRLFEGTGISARKVRRAAVTWLQNVSHLPVLVPDDPHVAAFMTELGLDERDLMTLADAAGLNLTVLDDVLLLEHQNRKEAARSASKGNGAKGAPQRAMPTKK